MKEGETKINFVLFDPHFQRSKEYVTDLFEIPVLEQVMIHDLKTMISTKLKEEKKH